MVILKRHTPVVLDKVAIVLTGNVIYNRSCVENGELDKCGNFMTCI